MKRYQPTPEDIAMLQTMNTGKRRKLGYWMQITLSALFLWFGCVAIVLLAISQLPEAR